MNPITYLRMFLDWAFGSALPTTVRRPKLFGGFNGPGNARR